jgi:peptidoglycan hydrolase-like protein with peptidoglycan-binding domain
VRKRAGRPGWGRSAAIGDAVAGRWLRFWRSLGLSARDAVAIVVVVFATTAILVNVLLMQQGAHPAPIFKGAQSPAKPALVAQSTLPAASRPRPVEPIPAPSPGKVAAPPASRSPGEIINDIQRELARRGYYDGTIDGLYGPKTDGAIRDFEHAAGLKPSTEPNEGLLQAIMRTPAKVTRGPAGPPGRPPMPMRGDPAADRPIPSRRVIALQRALAEYGYGQIKPTGILDAETQAAIEKFERERRLPITGQPSERVTRELASMIGRPLE